MGPNHLIKTHVISFRVSEIVLSKMIKFLPNINNKRLIGNFFFLSKLEKKCMKTEVN